MLEGDTPGVLYGCEYKAFAGIGICKVMKIKGDKNRVVGGSCGGGMLAGEVRRARERAIGASVGVNDSRRGTRGQLVGGTVEVQLAGIFSSRVV